MKRVDDIARSNLSLPAKWLAVFMTHHENRNGEVITTVADIRAWTGLSKAALRAAIDDLINSRFLTEVQSFKPGPNSSAKFVPTWGDTPRRSATPAEIRHDVAQLLSDGAEAPNLDTPRINDPEIPSPLNNPSSNPSPLLSPLSSFSPVLENEELRQEQEVTREAQGELISTDTPAWLMDLRTTPGYDLDAAHERRLIERVDAAAISTQRLCEAATSIAAKWESYKWSPTNKRGYKRLDLTFFAWATRKELNGGKPNNGRYRAPGTFVPKGGTPEAYARWPAQTYDDA